MTNKSVLAKHSGIVKTTVIFFSEVCEMFTLCFCFDDAKVVVY